MEVGASMMKPEVLLIKPKDREKIIDLIERIFDSRETWNDPVNWASDE